MSAMGRSGHSVSAPYAAKSLDELAENRSNRDLFAYLFLVTGWLDIADSIQRVGRWMISEHRL